MDLLKEQKTKKGLLTEKRIFNVAIKLINLNGYDNVTIKDICKESNIGIGTFYHHFKSKQELLINYVRMESKEIIEYNDLLNNDSIYLNLLDLIKYQLSYFDIKGKKFVNNIYIVALSKGLDSTGFYKYSLFKIIYNYVETLQNENIFSNKHDADFITDTIINSIFAYSIYWISSNNKNMENTYYSDIVNLIELFLN